MIKEGKTSTGYEYRVEVERLDNMELLEAIAEVDKGVPSATPRVIELLIGTEEKAKLYNHVREEDGRVPVEPLMKEIMEIFKSLGDDAKNC